MSQSERKTDVIGEAKMMLFERSGWQCVYVDEKTGERCAKQATQAAHILPQDVVHIARYGPSVIHHIDNLRGTCPKHNAAVQINVRARPVEADAHADAIREKIAEEEV